MIIHASAPVRLDFAGGWTDVAPFATEERGVVVSGAIALHATATLEIGDDGYRLEAKDLGQAVTVASIDQLESDGQLDLLKAAVRMYQLPPCRLVTRSEVPPGSGLGSSGALDVALVAACEAAVGRTPTGIAIAERAWELEAVEAALPGGKQDQYAAALGGFNRLDFGPDGVTVRPFSLPPGFGDLLADRIVVCYTGQSRVSSAMIGRVMTKYVRRDPTVSDALREMTVVADTMALALEEGDLVAVANLIARSWRLQRQLDPGMETPEMAALETALRHAGALGGKAAGAGAGGTMFFVLDRSPREAARVAREGGATVLPLRWAKEGVRVW